MHRAIATPIVTAIVDAGPASIQEMTPDAEVILRMLLRPATIVGMASQRPPMPFAPEQMITLTDGDNFRRG